MRLGTKRALTIDRKEISAAYIGKGMFCRAYRYGDMVYLLCEEDYSKECTALFCDQNKKHIPTIKRHDSIGEFQVFSMPFYHKLTKREYPQAYTQWKTLPTIIRSYSEANTYIDSEQNNTPESVREAIRELIDAFSNYDVNSMLLEFNRSNMGVNDTGELILRDCLVSKTSIEQVREKRRKHFNRGKNVHLNNKREKTTSYIAYTQSGNPMQPV